MTGGEGTRPVVAAVAGRRIDAPGGPRRFPASNESLVRERLREVFAQHRVETIVSSAACGTDLIALEVAGDLGLRRVVVLPQAPAAFRATSAADRGESWGRRFDGVIAEVLAAGDLRILDPAQAGNAGYSAANELVLSTASDLAGRGNGRPRPFAIVVWNGESRGEGDLTIAFRARARTRGFDVIEVSTL